MKGTVAFWTGPVVAVLFLLAPASTQDKPRSLSEQWTRISEILIAPKSTSTTEPSANELEAAQARAEDAQHEIESGSPFALVAIKYSDGPSAKKGGDVGYFKHGSLPGPIDEKASALRLFQVSDVIPTKQGFVLVQVTDRRDSEENPTKEIAEKERLQAAAYVDSVKEKIMDQWYGLMPREASVERQKATIVVDLTIVNTGQVAWSKVEQSSSWNTSLEKAALNAVKQAQPFPPYSSEYGGCCVQIRMHFLYNPSSHN